MRRLSDFMSFTAKINQDLKNNGKFILRLLNNEPNMVLIIKKSMD
jgi:hypothetical protein